MVLGSSPLELTFKIELGPRFFLCDSIGVKPIPIHCLPMPMLGPTLDVQSWALPHVSHRMGIGPLISLYVLGQFSPLELAFGVELSTKLVNFLPDIVTMYCKCPTAVSLKLCQMLMDQQL